MAKIFPNSPAIESPPSSCDRTAVAAMTVWRKSLLFNCKGFTVYDSRGDLLFRVDNYSATRSGGEIVLMDSSGKSLLTIRRKRLSLGEKWLIYNGDEVENPIFSVKKHVMLFGSEGLARVTPRRGFQNRLEESYEIEGSYSRRECRVYDGRRRAVAEVARKEAAAGVALGGDVFRLIAKPEIDAAFAMAVVVVLDQMYGT
ncbi:protein LURP-one-related 8-like [Iris pallida]|uniref:Protein LURP-one-related 8-like n=1 Tax=Iris pallida TaxID=29817 RepID=A0AAX6DFX8_IRIPA|nr:protein LURP-one-related 8-like [Iris pallida]